MNNVIDILTTSTLLDELRLLLQQCTLDEIPNRFVLLFTYKVFKGKIEEPLTKDRELVFLYKNFDVLPFWTVRLGKRGALLRSALPVAPAEEQQIILENKVEGRVRLSTQTNIDSTNATYGIRLFGSKKRGKQMH
jgi:hypothetical protein